MAIITLEGLALANLLNLLNWLARPDLDPIHQGEIHQIQVARDDDGVKFTINGSDWSPPYPIAAEDIRREHTLTADDVRREAAEAAARWQRYARDYRQRSIAVDPIDDGPHVNFEA